MASHSLRRCLSPRQESRVGAGTMRPHFGFLPELHEMIRKLNDNISPQDVAPHGDNPEARPWNLPVTSDGRERRF